jgi:isopenicillin N synthase-like dioxygenase
MTQTSQIGHEEHDTIVTQAGYVPVIDLGSARGHGPEARLAVAGILRTACETSGFFTVVGHGVPTAVVSEMYEANRKFFALPNEQKTALRSAPDDPLMRGFGREGSVAAANDEAPVAQERTLPDLAQTFIYNRLGEPGVAHLPAGADPMFAAPNLWPDLPGFADAYRRYYAVMDELARELMRLFALALDLPETWFDDKIDDHMTNLVTNYYPPQPTPPAPGQLRKGQHSDWGSLTILYQDSAPGGLQVLDKTGRWLDVPYVDGSFVVNIGDLMAIWTNDRWVSTVHRVVNPPREHADRERYSIPFFHQPNLDALIECIPTCTGPGNPPRHQAVRSGQYLKDKLKLAFGA